MQAITTKHLPATDTKGRRVKATCQGGNITVAWDYELDDKDNHINAAIALIDKLGWYGKFSIGETKQGYAIVFNADTVEVKRPW